MDFRGQMGKGIAAAFIYVLISLWYCLRMRLHRALQRADWVGVPPEKLSAWQEIGRKTDGWLTPGNVVSLFGLVLTLTGLGLIHGQHYVWSVLLIGVGRCADILDGAVAEYTHTKSYIGEAVDAAVDKIELLAAALVIFWIQTIPTWLILAIIVPNLIISAASLYAKQRDLIIHPSRTGKLATGSVWVAIGAYLLNAITAVTAWQYIAGGLLVAALLLSLAALGMYGRQIILHEPSKMPVDTADADRTRRLV